MTRILAAILAYLVVIGISSCSVHSGSRLPTLQAGGPMTAAANPAISLEACSEITTDQTTYTFSSFDVGTATSDRITVVGIMGGDSAALFRVSSVTVGGASAARATEEAHSATGSAVSAFWSLANPSGDTEDVVVTWDEAVVVTAICVFKITGAASAQPYAWNMGFADSGGLMTLNHVTYANGVSAGICMAVSGTMTWAGLTETTDTDGTEISYSSATFTNDGTADLPLSASCDPSAVANSSAIAAHWRGPAVATPSITFIGCTTSDSNLTTYTFSSHSVGTAQDNRVTVVGVLGEDALTTFGVSTVTVGGASASELVDEDGTGIVNTAIYSLINPAGTAEDIVVTFSEAVTSAVICVWALYDIGDFNGIYQTSVQINGVPDDDTASGALVLTHETLKDGFSIAICNNSGVADSATWSLITEQVDSQTGEQDYSAAHIVEDADNTSVAATCDWTGGNDASGSVVHLR